jgi:NADH-quinone oxidoreductase subunit E
MIFDDDVKQQVDAWIAKYPADQKRSAVVAALLIAQEKNGGWLSESVMNEVAAYLELARIEVYEVATFYDLFELKQTGKHKIAICTNIACLLRGSDAILAAVKTRLGIDVNQTTKDGQFYLRETECLAACTGAPMCQIDDKAYHEHLTPERMIALIDALDQHDQRRVS